MERAKIHIGVNNGCRLMSDSRKLGTGSDWRSITEYDTSPLLKRGGGGPLPVRENFVTILSHAPSVGS